MLPGHISSVLSSPHLNPLLRFFAIAPDGMCHCRSAGHPGCSVTYPGQVRSSWQGSVKTLAGVTCHRKVYKLPFNNTRISNAICRYVTHRGGKQLEKIAMNIVPMINVWGKGRIDQVDTSDSEI